MGVAQVASASPTLVLDVGTYQSGIGGEFTAKDSLPGSFGLTGYSAWTSTGSGSTLTFDTFCVQAGDDDVTFVPGTTYDYAYSGTIIGGAMDSPPRTLNLEVAWLYAQFASGNLAGYDYDNASDGRTADAAILQNAIWFLEGEGGADDSAYDTAFNTYITDNHITGGYTAGEFGVDVLNLSTGTGKAVQNQLVYNEGGFTGGGHPIPDNGLTIALIGVSFLGLALYRRKAVKA